MRDEEQYVERMKGVGNNEVEGETSRIKQRIEREIEIHLESLSL